MKELHNGFLLVEDSAGDVELMQKALRNNDDSIRLKVVAGGVEAMNGLRRKGVHVGTPRSDFILLDLNRPKMDGRKAPEPVEEDEDLKTIPTVILTTSDAYADILTSYELHANCYFGKPVQLEEFESLVTSIDEFWLTKVKLPRQDFLP